MNYNEFPFFCAVQTRGSFFTQTVDTHSMHSDERKRMVDKLVNSGYVRSEQVVKAMETIPRHIFVPENYRQFSYSDTPLQIGEGQTISAPHMVGMMLELLELEKGHKVLEVGCGSGYHAALAGYLVGSEGHVYTIEIIEDLAKRAQENINAVGLHDRITILWQDGSKGLPEHAPFDRIMAACSAPAIPEPLVRQLKDPGIMVIPVGSGYYQYLYLVRKERGKITKKERGGVAFVPMRGEFGMD